MTTETIIVEKINNNNNGDISLIFIDSLKLTNEIAYFGLPCFVHLFLEAFINIQNKKIPIINLNNLNKLTFFLKK
jgi:hypothetical protein